MWLALPLTVSIVAGCRGPRITKLKALQAPLAFLLPATNTVSPAPSPSPLSPSLHGSSLATATSAQSHPDSRPATSAQPSAHPPLETARLPLETSQADDLMALASHNEPLQDLSVWSVQGVPPGVAITPDSARVKLQDDTPPPLASGVENLPSPLGEPTGGSDSGDASHDPGSQLSGRPEVLGLQEVLTSATESFPTIREASLLQNLAIGNQIDALGAFDDQLEAFTINQPLSFYENYRHGVGWKKPRLMGGTTYAGYRIGAGDFEPWYKERETNEGGEFKAGFDIPLLRDRAIDPRRTAVRLATLDIQKANPELFQQVLKTQYEAATAYWAWLAAAKQQAIALELMRLAEQRVDRMETLIKAGDIATIVGIDNRRLLALRRERLIEAQQKLDTAALQLSLYYRDSLGRPLLPTARQQPREFPPLPNATIDIEGEVTRALLNRPELQILQVNDEQLRTELRLAINQRLPDISFSSEISQDVGGLASSKGDKQPFILEAGLVGSVPVQRRKAIGKAQALRAKLAQIDAKRQLASDRISNEVRQAATIYEAAIARLEQAQITRQLAQQTLDAGEVSFAAGDVDILQLNIYEQAFADAGIDIVLAQADLLRAQAMLITATGQSLLDLDIDNANQTASP